jgi:hypothetical protein
MQSSQLTVINGLARITLPIGSPPAMKLFGSSGDGMSTGSGSALGTGPSAAVVWMPLLGSAESKSCGSARGKL